MRRTFLLPEKTSRFILLFFVASCFILEVEAIYGPSVDNWCSEKHCNNCAINEHLRCSENAVSSSCGDLCGCCQSCVHFRDLGESCGSQLAVRSSANANFDDAKSRVTIIATSICKRGSVCTDFVCQGKNEALDSFDTAEAELYGRLPNTENGFPEFRDLPTDLKNQSQFDHEHYNHNEVKYPRAGEYEGDALARKITRPTFTAEPRPPLTKLLFKVRAHGNKKQVSGFKIQKPVMPALAQKIFFGSSRRFLNLIIDDREFQLIYGHDALADLKILLNSVDKSQPNSILNKFQAQTIYERFKNLLDYINEEKDKSVANKDANLYPQTSERANNPKNEELNFPGYARDSKKNFLLKNNQLHRILNTKSPQLVGEQLRGKRETESPKVHLGMQRDNANPKRQVDRGPNLELPVYNFVKQTPRTMENVDRHWPLSVEGDAEDKLPMAGRMELGATETAMNIHITGVPGPGNTPEDLGLQAKSRKRERGGRDESVEEDYGHYDVGLEVFVTEANDKVPAMEAEEDLENLAKVEGFERYKKVARVSADNVTESPASQTSQFTGNVYQFTFPKTLESDSLRELTIRVNETVEEFRARLDRIETKVVAIASSIFDHFLELPSNERPRITGESEDSSVSINANPVGRQLAAMNTQTLDDPTTEKANQFTEIPAMGRRAKSPRFPEANSTGSSQHRRWRDFQSFFNSGGRRRRPNKMGGYAADFSQRNSRGKIVTRFPGGLENKFSAPNAHIFSTRKWTEDTPNFSAQFTTPVIFSNANYRQFSQNSSASIQKNQHTSKEFAGEESSYEMDADPVLDSSLIASHEKILWPLNPAWNWERNKRTSTPENSAIVESIFSLETQIPEPIRSEVSRIFGHQPERKSHSVNDKFSRQFLDDDRNLEPSFKLFIVEDKNPELELEKSLEAGKSPKNFVLPAKNLQTMANQRNPEVDDNWDPIYPEYLDYAEEAQKNEDEDTIAEEETTEIPDNHPKTQRIGLGYHNRKKRNVGSGLQEEKLDWKKNWLNDVPKDLDPNNKSVNEDNMYRSFFSTVFGNGNEKSSENTISTELPRKRKRRSVQMVDWLRVAEEYHERLEKIRTAALKTWLASRDELENSNPANVKLFTREIPVYLEKYAPSYDTSDHSTEGSVGNRMYSVVAGDPEKSMTNDDELFGKMVADLSSHLEDGSKENEERSPGQSPEISNSSVPRKFTIFTTGNSTIRIEDMSKMTEDGFGSSLEDQSQQDSTSSEVLDHELDFVPSESEIFDHMYESIDAEDEDFDYGDPGFAISSLFDDVDIVDDADEESLEDGLEATSEDSFGEDEDLEEDDEEDDDIAELFSRTKRDSPFFLFKVRGRPAQDVVIWPSNWQNLISRHLKFNRSRSSATQTQKGTRRSYVKLSKVAPKHVPILETSAKSFSTRGPPLSKVEKNSVEMNSMHGVQHPFDQSRKWIPLKNL